MSLVSRRTARTARLASKAPRRFTAGVVVACLASAVSVLGPAPAPAAAETADTTAPTWGAVTVNPETITTAASAAAVTVTARIVDDQAGIISSTSGTGGAGYLSFRTPGSTQSLSAYLPASTRISGTAQDGTYRTTLTVPRYAASGTWSISSASVSDSAGNGRYLSSPAELSAAGLTASFTQTAAGDTTAARFAGLTFSPATIDTSEAARTVTARVRITDDLSGLNGSGGGPGGYASIGLRGPNVSSGLSVYVSSYNRVSGTATDGVYEATVTVPRYSAPGTWRVDTAWLVDAAGNSYNTVGTEEGLTGSFEQTGPGDSTAPTMSEVTVSPTAVNTAVSAQDVTVRARITDDLAGLIDDPSASNDGSATVTFSSDGTVPAYATASFTAQNRISGTATDGVYETTMSVPRGARGHFTASTVTLTDAAGNYRYAGSSGLGSPAFDVVDTVSVPSAPTGVTVTAGNGSATVNWVRPARDGGAAITGYRIRASTGASGMLGDMGPCGPLPPVSSTPTGQPDVTVLADGSATSATVTGLVNGTSYEFTVTATNSAGWGAASNPTPKIKPFDAANDTTPPVLRRLEVSPASVDTTDGPATVTVAACITDDLAGLSRSYPTSWIALRSPSGRQTLNASFDEAHRVAGGPLDGLYRVTLTLPRYSEAGRWTATVSLVDAVNNSTSLSATQLADANLPNGVDQTGAVADTTAPVVADLDISPATIDTSTDAQTVTVTAHITDDLSGLAAYNRPSLWFRSPSGRQMASAALTLQTGDNRDGVWTGSFTVARYSEAGLWTTAGLSLSDSIGNSRSVGPEDLANAGLPSGFTQTGTGDTTAPTLAGLTLSPAAVDTSTAAQTLAVTAHVVDAGAGIAPSGYGLSLSLRSPSGRQTLYSSTPVLQTGTPVDGTWQLSVTVPVHAETGRWTINGVSLTDQMNNQRSVSFDELAAAGLPNSFDQTGAGDTSPPAVQSLTFTPDPVDTSAGGQTVTVRARFTDDRAGVTYAYLEMVPPSGGSPRYVNLGRTSGNGTDGVWEGQIGLPRYAEAGPWRVSTLRIFDAVSNSTVLTAADLRAAGVSSSFTQTGAADTSGPVLAGLTWTPGAVDTSGAARTVTVRARFTDDLSGLPATTYGPSMLVQSPSGGQTVYANFSRVSGTTGDATYEAELTVPRYSEAGAWAVKDLGFSDQAGNYRHIAAADITAAGFEAGFTQTGPADTDAPTLVSVSAAPAEVDTSSGSATVVVSARITDAQSGLSMFQGNLTFTNASGGQTLKGYLGNPVSGSIRDGRYQISVTVPRYAEPGVWRLSAVELADQVGNKAVLGAAELAAAGLSASFEQTGTTGDGQAPVLADFSVNPDAVNVATSAQRVTVRARVTDDLAGVNANVGLFLTSPSGDRTISPSYSEWTRISGTARDGVYETTVIVPFRAEAGTWAVKVTLSDGAGNTAELSGAALTGLGFTASLAVAAEVGPSAPGAPWGVTASAGNAAATVAWNAPADDGGSPVTGYRVIARSGGVTVKTVTVDAAATTAEVSGLTNGTTYTFTVTASNAIGTGPESTPSNATTPATVPGVPTGVSASPVPRGATVRWTRPDSDGGNSVGSYSISVRRGGSEVGTETAPSGATSWEVPGLTNGTEYTFTVTAWNSVGAGAASDASNPVTPLAPPTAPGDVTATAGNGSATVAWSAPADNGGTPVVSYTITASAGGAAAKTVVADAPATSAVVDGLSNGTAYRFSVAAANAFATGAGSAQSAAVTPVTTPDTPTNVIASPRDASAVVRWTAPAGNGGSALTGYTITAYAGDAVVKTVTASKSAAQVTVGGLENGVAYRFTVAASNAVGMGAASSPSAEVTPTAPPPSSSTSSTSTTTTTGPQPTTTTTTPTTTTTAPPVNVVPAKARSGYWMVSAEGRVYAFGDALHHGEPRAQLGNAVAVDLEPTGSGNGYWVLDDAGRVYPYGDARWFGNLNPTRLAAGERATSLSRTVSGAGYWIFTNRGRVLTFGDAVAYGDVAAVALNGPVLDSIVTPSGKGYYMVASDGGIFAFGDAKFHGSMGGTKLNAPVQSLVPDTDGEGYWLVASDGGIFAFKAPFRGSMGSQRLNHPVSGMVPFGAGYLMVGEDGGIFNFSDRPFLGSLGAAPPPRPVVAVAVLES